MGATAVRAKSTQVLLLRAVVIVILISRYPECLDFKIKSTPAHSVPAKRQPDAVDAILAQWKRELPDLDLGPMGTIGRIKRCAALLQRRLDETFATFGLNGWEVDVLATLRRSGAPYSLSPTVLFSAMMVTSGTMTHRLQALETRGLVDRVPSAEDARSMLVQLTPAGLELINQAIRAHVENERRILANLNATELKGLDQRMIQLMKALDPTIPESLQRTTSRLGPKRKPSSGLRKRRKTDRR